MENLRIQQPEHDILLSSRCFSFLGLPQPQSWDDPSLPLCWEHGREEGSGLLVPVNGQLVILILFFPIKAATRRIMVTMSHKVAAWKLLVSLIVRCLQINCMSVIPLLLPRSRWPNCSDRAACTCSSHFNDCASDNLYSPLLWVSSCSELSYRALFPMMSPLVPLWSDRRPGAEYW